MQPIANRGPRDKAGKERNAGTGHENTSWLAERNGPRTALGPPG
jgi:hypothetical protein